MNTWHTAYTNTYTTYAIEVAFIHLWNRRWRVLTDWLTAMSKINTLTLINKWPLRGEYSNHVSKNLFSKP